MVVHKRLLIQPCTNHKLECFTLFTFTVYSSCFKFYMNMNDLEQNCFWWAELEINTKLA